jgi:hypothetical protein
MRSVTTTWAEKGFVPVGYTPMNFITGDGNVHSTILDLAMWEDFLTEFDDELARRDTGGLRELFVGAGKAQESQAG